VVILNYLEYNNEYYMKKGFTVIEMLIVVAILGVISAALITSMHVGERQIALFKEQARIINVLSRAKALSIATFGEGGSVPCGFGVHFEAPNKFLIFKDLATASDCVSADKKYSDSSEIYESFQLDSRVAFDALGLSDIVFIPPAPTVIINLNGVQQDQATIIIKTVSGSDSKTIKINSAGQIST